MSTECWYLRGHQPKLPLGLVQPRSGRKWTRWPSCDPRQGPDRRVRNRGLCGHLSQSVDIDTKHASIRTWMNKRYNVSFKVLSNWGNNYNKIIIIRRKGKHFTFAEAAPTFIGFFTERSLRGTSSRHGILTSPKSSTSSPWSLSISSNPASLRAAGPSLVPGFVYKCKHKTIFMNRAHTKHCQVNFI